MSLKVIVDEDLPRRAVLLLREYGYDVAGVVERGMNGWLERPSIVDCDTNAKRVTD